jgi:hypothetical protein
MKVLRSGPALGRISMRGANLHNFWLIILIGTRCLNRLCFVQTKLKPQTWNWIENIKRISKKTKSEGRKKKFKQNKEKER